MALTGPLHEPVHATIHGRWSTTTLKGQLDLERHGGRTTSGLYARIAQRLLAMAVCIWHNWATTEPVRRSLTAYVH